MSLTKNKSTGVTGKKGVVHRSILKCEGLCLGCLRFLVAVSGIRPMARIKGLFGDSIWHSFSFGVPATKALKTPLALLTVYFFQLSVAQVSRMFIKHVLM